MAMTEEKMEGGKEGNNLMGFPSFTVLENGRYKCIETGHEMLEKDKESYSQSKRCRLGLMDFALANNKPPLNMFKQDPSSLTKLICKLTGDTVNKSEEHIWKHINGKRFLNKLEQKETENFEEKLLEESKSGTDVRKKKKKNKKKGKVENPVEEIISEVRNSSNKDSDSEEADFWMPSVGDRWDFDDGGGRWGSGGESEQESEEENGGGRWGSGGESEQESEEENGEGVTSKENGESEELSKRTKRMSIEIGPCNFASRKKKSKKDSTS